MVAAALLWIILPLLRPDADAAQRKERRLSSAVIAVAVPALAVAMYAGLSNWDWQAAEMAAASEADMEQRIDGLEKKLASNPQNVPGWVLLGKSYMELGRAGRAVDAFQRAYDVSRGEDIEAVIGLGEALVMMDPSTLTGRAGKLFDAALERAPNHPKALWYGSLSALQAGDLRRGRDRLQLLLAQNPPPELRSVLERQIQDLNEQLNETAPASQPATSEGGAAPQQRTIRVAVTLAPQVRSQLTGSVPLFILARDPAAGGPPLAVQRHNSADLPLTVELSERDAMIATRTIASVPRVQVVARLSRSGAPQAQSGDFYGEATYDFEQGDFAGGDAQAATLNIIIDRTVP